MQSALILGAVGGAWALAKASSASVRRYRRPDGERHDVGPLSVRSRAGDERRTVVLLHGLLGSGDAFGADFDELAAVGSLLVPDLLGFGRSLAGDRGDFDLAAHLAALDGMLTLSPPSSRLVVAGHSLGGLLALSWAARHSERVEAVVTWGAPLFRSRDEGVALIASFGFASRMLALDTPWSRRACALMCQHRTAAGWLAALTSPRVPVHLARQGVLHTWAAYRGALEDVLLSRWREAIEALAAADVPMTLIRGTHDPVALEQVHREVAALRNVAHVVREAAGHDLPLSDPRQCVRDVHAAISSSRGRPYR